MSASKEAILQAFSQFLDQAGIKFGDEDMYGESETLPDNSVPVWAALKTGVPDTQRGPIHSREALFDASKMAKPPQVGNFNQYGMPTGDGQEEFMTAMGLV